MTNNDIKNIYEKSIFNDEYSVSDLDPQGIFLKNFLPLSKKINILDAGCGNGRYSNMVSQLGYENINAVDLLDTCNFEGKNFIYYKSDIRNTPFENVSLDFIYSFSVLFYLKNLNEGVKEFHRILKKNGILMITAHTKYSFFTLERVLKGKKLKHLEGVKFYTANYYKKLLEENGFEIVHMDGFNTSYFLYPWYRKFANRFKLNLPKIPSTVTKNHFLSLVRSELSYHSVIVAKKK